MRHPVPETRVVTSADAVTCDKCGAWAKSPLDLPAPGDANVSYIVLSGAQYRWDDGDMSDYHRSTIDMCAVCFSEWLIPLMREHGVGITEEDSPPFPKED